MKALLTAAVAAIEGCAVALAGILVVALPAVLLWWLAFGFAAEPAQVASATAGLWLLAHFVPMSLELAPEAALGLGLPPEAIDFSLSLAPLGLTLLTVLLAFRAGWRFAGRGATGSAGVLGGTLGFAGAALAIVLVGTPSTPWPAWSAVLVPSLCFAAGTCAGYVWRSALDGEEWWAAAVRLLQRGIEPLGAVAAAALPARSLEVLRLATAMLFALIGLSALGFAVAIVVGYVEIVTLSQAMQLDALGILLLFLLNLALLPVVCVWGVAWFSGSGFALGSGTSVTPFETLLGPVPALPILGTVPQGWGWAAVLAPLLVLVSGVVVGTFAARSPGLRAARWGRAVAVPLMAAVLVGLAVAALSALASGSIGPGRMADTGPAPWLTGGLIAVESAAGLLIGVLAGRADYGRLRRSVLDGEVVVPGSGAAGPVDPAPVLPETEPAPAPVATADAAARAETVPLEPLPPAGPPPIPAEDPRAPAGQLPADADADTILRAYAWDEGDGSDTDPESTGGKRRWPFRRRRG